MLLSIKPEHVKNILIGKKQYEFRKVRSKASVDRIIIYCTSPVMQVVGEVDVLDVIVDEPNTVWEQTESLSGITKDFFDSYFDGKDYAVAYKLGKVKRYKKPLSLEHFGLNFAPQSFVYI